MSNNLGRKEGGGFLPAEPSAQGLLNALGLGTGGWDALNNDQAGKPLQDARAQAQEDLKKCFAQVYATPAGKKMIEALLDQTLRRSPYLVDENASLEQHTAYGLQRKGQNGLMTSILSMIHEGQNLKPKKGGK